MEPNVVNSPPPPEPSRKNSLLQILNWKTVLVVFGLVVLAEVIWGVSILLKPVPKPELAPKQIVPMASLAVSSAMKEPRVGDLVKVDVVLNTGTRLTDGTDVILLYDPSALTVQPASGSAVPVSPGTLYKEYPVNTVDQNGKISLSGIDSQGNGVSGKGVLGTVVFKALKSGSTTVKIDYQNGSTSHSNVVETKTSRNILISVSDLTLNIK